MAKSDNKQATFSINFEDNMSSGVDSAGDSLEELQKRMSGSIDKLKGLQQSLRNLHGPSDDVRKMKEEIIGKMQAEKAAITKANVAILKQGSSYAELTAKAKKTASTTDAVGKAVTTAGGPVAALRDHLTSLRDILGGTNGAAGYTTLALAGLAAGVAAVTGAVLAGAVSLGKWILEVTNARRTANLFREAALGSAQGASDLGAQIDAVAAKVSTPKGKIEELAVSLSKMRLSGRAIVDTMNLVTQASDAMGDDVGKKLEDVITRGQMSGRVGLNPMELLGTNVDFDAVAQELAAGTGKSVKAARNELLIGRAPIEQAAAALRNAVEKKFGDLNLRKMLDIHVIASKFQETLANLTKDVKIEPLLRALADMAKMFDKNTTTGSAMKALITLIGDGMVKVATGGAPIMKAAFIGLIIGVMKTVTAIYQVRNAWNKVLGDNEIVSRIEAVTAATTAARIAVYGIAAGLGLAAGALAVVGVLLNGAVEGFVGLYEGVSKAGTYIAGLDWGTLGSNLIDGFVSGVKTRIPIVNDMMGGFAEDVKNRFKAALGIHSPSKVFADFGRNTVAGYEAGVEGASPGAQAAVDGMVSPSGASPGGGGGARASSSAGAPVELHLHIHSNASDPKEVANEVSSAGILAQITKAVLDATATGG